MGGNEGKRLFSDPRLIIFYIIATKAIRKQAWPEDTYFKLAATMQIKLVQWVT